MDIRPPKRWKQKTVQAELVAVDLPDPTVLPRPDTSKIQPATPDGPKQDDFSKKKKKRLRLISIICGILVVVVASLLAVFGWYNWALQPYDSDDASRHRVVIASGETADEIASELEEKNIIRSKIAFAWFVKMSGAKSNLRAGSYMFSASQPVSDIVEWLETGKTGIYNVTILPGMTLRDLADPNLEGSLAEQGFTQAEIKKAFSTRYTSLLLSDKPEGASLEGYIFPETYQMQAEDSLESLFERTFDELYRNFEEDGLIAAFKTHNLNMHQAITLASIIQKETSVAKDQPQVAQVFLKRLGIGMQLGSDVTFIFAAEQDGREPSVNYDSPYNTRKYTGLPPGPIANMNYSALQAVASPAAGDYLYFVAGDDGTTHFSNTEAEHVSAVRQYCTKLCD